MLQFDLNGNENKNGVTQPVSNKNIIIMVTPSFLGLRLFLKHRMAGVVSVVYQHFLSNAPCFRCLSLSSISSVGQLTLSRYCFLSAPVCLDSNGKSQLPICCIIIVKSPVFLRDRDHQIHSFLWSVFLSFHRPMTVTNACVCIGSVYIYNSKLDCCYFHDTFALLSL